MSDEHAAAGEAGKEAAGAAQDADGNRAGDIHRKRPERSLGGGTISSYGWGWPEKEWFSADQRRCSAVIHTDTGDRGAGNKWPVPLRVAVVSGMTQLLNNQPL